MLIICIDSLMNENINHSIMLMLKPLIFINIWSLFKIPLYKQCVSTYNHIIPDKDQVMIMQPYDHSNSKYDQDSHWVMFFTILLLDVNFQWLASCSRFIYLLISSCNKVNFKRNQVKILNGRYTYLYLPMPLHIVCTS